MSFEILAFLSKQVSKTSLFFTSPRYSEVLPETMVQTQITVSELGTFVENIHPTWSPDGTMIAFASNRDDNWEIYVVLLETMKQYRLTNNNFSDGFNGLAWKPNSDGIVFVQDGGIYFDEDTQSYEEQQLMLVETINLEQIELEPVLFNLTQNVQICDVGEVYHNPRWSNTNQLAFALSCGGGDFTDIYTMDMSQENALENPMLVNLTNNRIEYQAGQRGLAWNDIGTQLAFSALLMDETSSLELFLLDLALDAETNEYPIIQLTDSPTNTIYRDIDWLPIPLPQN